MNFKDKSRLTILGNVLLVLGVAVWAVYALNRWGLGKEVEVGRFLPYHLAGVIPGSLLRHRHRLQRWFKRLAPDKSP
jgi:hypothetical protein